MTIFGSATAAFMFARSTNMPAALGSVGKLIGFGLGTEVEVGRPAAVQARKPPCRILTLG